MMLVIFVWVIVMVNAIIGCGIIMTTKRKPMAVFAWLPTFLPIWLQSTHGKAVFTPIAIGGLVIINCSLLVSNLTYLKRLSNDPNRNDP